MTLRPKSVNEGAVMTKLDADLVEQLAAGGEPVFDTWSRETAEVWVRARFRCEYCDASFLENHRAYRTGQVDHILPKSRFGEPNTTLGLALACSYCNSVKSAGVYGSEEEQSRLQAGDSRARVGLIERVRQDLATRRAKSDIDVAALATWLTRDWSIR